MKKTKKIIAIILISMLIMLANSVTFAVSTSWSYDSSSKQLVYTVTDKDPYGDDTTIKFYYKVTSNGNGGVSANVDHLTYNDYNGKTVTEEKDSAGFTAKANNANYNVVFEPTNDQIKSTLSSSDYSKVAKDYNVGTSSTGSSSSAGTSSSTSKTSSGNITTAWKNVNTGSPELIKNFDGEEYHIYYSRQSDGTWKATSITLPSGVTVTSSQANFKSEISKVASETLQSIPGRDTDTGSSTSSTSGTGISTIGTGQITQDSGMNKMISTIFGIVQYICIAAAVIVMLITGVRYMIVAPDQKAEIKKQSIALVVGAVIIFSISTILKIIADITSATIK